MNKTSIYRQQLLDYLDRDEGYNAILQWIEEQPDLDQSDILRELQCICKEHCDKTGEQDW
jgi:hypothetical protein